MQLDVNTLILVTTLLGLVLVLVLFNMWQNYPASVQGVGDWGVAVVATAATTWLLFPWGGGGDWLLLMLAPGAGCLAMYLFFRGCQRFLDLPASIWSWALGFCLSLLAAYYCGGRGDDATWAVLVPMVVILMGMWATAQLLWQHGQSLFSNRFTFFVFAIELAIGLLCALAMATRFNPFAVFEASAVRTLFVASLGLANVALGIGFVLMATDRMRGELERLLAHDLLTGALTHRFMTEAFDAELDRFHRSGREVSVLVVDLDDFQKLHTDFGRASADKILVDFVERVKSVLRRTDKLGRLGGEEFVIMLPETPLPQAQLVAERLRLAASSAISTGLISYTVSIGLTVCHEDDTSLESMIGRASFALGQAKQAGCNRVEVA